MEKLYNGGFYPAMNFQKCVHLTENYTILYRYYIYYCHWTHAVVYQKTSMNIFGALLTMSLIKFVMDSECKEGAKYVSLSMIGKEKRWSWLWLVHEFDLGLINNSPAVRKTPTGYMILGMAVGDRFCCFRHQHPGEDAISVINIKNVSNLIQHYC